MDKKPILVDTLKRLDPAVYADVHMRVGIALWLGQSFENVLAYYVTLILKLPNSRAEVEMRAVFEKAQSQTLGGLIAELRKANSTNSVSEFEQRINHYLDERNWLVHSSWIQHHGDLFEPQRLSPLIQRLEAIAEEASSLQKYFSQLVHNWTIAQGVDPATIEVETRRILEARGVI